MFTLRDASSPINTGSLATPVSLSPRAGSHRASMNQSIFGYGVAASHHRSTGVEEGRRRERERASWPEWCFPGVSTSIYLPGAYSDKSVIAAGEASERVALATPAEHRCSRHRPPTRPPTHPRHLPAGTKTERGEGRRV